VGAVAGSQVLARIVLVAVVLAGCRFVPPSDTVPPSSCCTYPPTGAPGGLTQDGAIAAARRFAPSASTAPTVVWAAIAEDPFAAPGSSVRGLVWEVRLQGSFGVPACPSGFLDAPPSRTDRACLDDASGLIVVLDYFSGAFEGWSH